MGESVAVPPTSHHCQTSFLHNAAMMSSNRNMHCLSLRTQDQLSLVRQWSTHTYFYTHSFMFMGLQGIHALTCALKHILTQPHMNVKHTQTHPLPHTLAVCPKVQNFWHCCLQAPLLAGKELAFHKHPSVCLYKLPGSANYTWALMSESTLCQSVCPSNSAEVVDKTG